MKKQVLELLQNREAHFTPGELSQALMRQFALKRSQAKAIINQMVTEGILDYSDCHGRTIIELSVNQPVRVSRWIVLKPPSISFRPEADDVVIQMQQGVSFGGGQHPTTRMALCGIEYLIENFDILDKNKKNAQTRLLDIGTGSGVLALAGLGLGIDQAIGLDIDPCAVSEARANAGLNKMQNRFQTANTPLENFLDEKFSLITANLRFPTLKQIYSHLINLCNCALVVSGIRTHEMPGLNACYEKKFKCVWQETEKNWGAMAFIRCKKES